MSALARVREKFKTDGDGTRKSSKSPSAGSAGSQDERFKLFRALEPRLVRMAERWQYTPDELADLLERARLDPAGWLRAVALDEGRESEFRAQGLLT